LLFPEAYRRADALALGSEEGRGQLR